MYELLIQTSSKVVRVKEKVSSVNLQNSRVRRTQKTPSDIAVLTVILKLMKTVCGLQVS